MQLSSFGFPTQAVGSFGFAGGAAQIAPQGRPAPFAPAGNPAQMMSMMFQLLGAITQLSMGWTAFGGASPMQQGYGQQPPFGGQPGGFPGGFPGGQPHFGGGGPMIDYASLHFPNLNNYNPQVGGGGYGGGVGPGLPRPSDPQEFASYLQAQVAGGALQGGTGIAQSDAIPGTRFGQVQDSTMWHASVGRTYAYQFAAYAGGHDPLSPQGVSAGMQTFEQMSPDAQLFMQVASVFKGNSHNGPGFYDNPGLKNLLLQNGLSDLANQPQVGQTDVQTIGAIAKAIDQGHLSLNDVINSGTIDNLNRYNQIIQYVQGGGFANDLRNYDTVPF